MSGAQCFAANAQPDGYAVPNFLQPDCAPEAPEVHPRAVDPWGDGIDWDCDEKDTPNCRNFRAGNVVLVAPLRLECEAAPDVYVSEALIDGCRALEDVHFFVGNRGGVDTGNPAETTEQLLALIEQIRDERQGATP